MSLSRINLGLVLLVSLCAWAHLSCPYPDLEEIFAHPQTYAGKRVAVFIEARVVELTAYGFVLNQRGSRLHVHTSEKNAPLNGFAAVAGIFQPPHHLQADTVHLAAGRRWKMAVSVIPVLLLVFLLPRALRYDRPTRTLILRVSPHA